MECSGIQNPFTEIKQIKLNLNSKMNFVGLKKIAIFNALAFSYLALNNPLRSATSCTLFCLPLEIWVGKSA